MARRKGLGRGLDALLKGSSILAADDVGDLRALPLDVIEPGRYQPRTQFDETALEELAASIREQGLLQPIVVRPLRSGHYEILAGERRWRACQLAGLEQIPALIRELQDQDALAIALIENIQREDLNALEEARALRRLIKEFQLSHAQAAAAVGRSRSAISNLLRLLDLNPEVQELMEGGALEMGHGRALLGLSGPEQSRVAGDVAARGLSARQTEALVRRRKKSAGSNATQSRRQDPDIAALERRLQDKIAARVEIKSRRGGRGSLVIHYSSLDELDGILGRIH